MADKIPKDKNPDIQGILQSDLFGNAMQQLMGQLDLNALKNMAEKQDEGGAASEIDPNQLMGLVSNMMGNLDLSQLGGMVQQQQQRPPPPSTPPPRLSKKKPMKGPLPPPPKLSMPPMRKSEEEGHPPPPRVVLGRMKGPKQPPLAFLNP